MILTNKEKRMINMYVRLYNIDNKLIDEFGYSTSYYGELLSTIDSIADEHKVDFKDIKIEIKEGGFLIDDKTVELYKIVKLILIDTRLLTTKALDKECTIHGFNIKTLEDLLFYHTSCRWSDIEQAQKALDAREQLLMLENFT